VATKVSPLSLHLSSNGENTSSMLGWRGSKCQVTGIRPLEFQKRVADVAASYGIYYQAQEGTPATGYLVDHWAGVMLIDRTGRLVELFSYGTPAEQIAADISEWL